MKRMFLFMMSLSTFAVLLFQTLPVAAEAGAGVDESQKAEVARSASVLLEELILKSSPYESVVGIATYYSARFDGHRTSSGHRYNPEKLTAAHESLPLGTVVRVINPASKQEVHVTINDRCAPRSFHFIDLSRAAAKRIGLWGKGKIKVVIIPLLHDQLEEPA